MEASRTYERGLLRGIARYARLHGPWQFYHQLPLISGGEQIPAAELKQWAPDGMIIREGQQDRSPVARVFRLGQYPQQIAA